MATRDFYAALPALTQFLDLANPDNYVDVPDDWYVLITDIANSTDAILAGRYKAVNLLGASSIMAVLNAVQPLNIPFSFGGDGASLLVPPDCLDSAREALLGVRGLAAQSFGLELRVGTVPVAVINRRAPLKIAKFRLTPHYCQASFIGGGITYATELIKKDATYRLDIDCEATLADLTGLECRWQDVPSRHGQTLSLIVAASARHQPSERVYRDVLVAIQQIYGLPEDYHPAPAKALRLSFNPGKLRAEVKARTDSSRTLSRLSYFLNIFIENLLGLLLMDLRLSAGGIDWGSYKHEVSAASDYQKIDDVLRMVISGTAAQTEKLTRYLDQGYQAGQLTYGIHVSNRALMTCLILDRRNHHFHLIDAADGGYAIAAKRLKAQLHRKARNWKSFMTLLDHQLPARAVPEDE